MKFLPLVLPAFILTAIIIGAIKKVNVYDSFASGVKDAIDLLFTVFPYLCAIFIMTELLQASGISDKIISFCAPAFEVLGIPREICPLVLLKPFSGSGSLALLSDVYARYGADSYISRCASCVFGSSETVFYVSAIYFSKCKNKKLFAPVCISLAACFISTVFACFICRFM